MEGKFSTNSFLRAKELTKHRKDTNIWKDEIEENCYHVKSQSDRIGGFPEWKVYFSFRGNRWICECPNFWRTDKYCKHILAVIIKLKDEEKARNK